MPAADKKDGEIGMEPERGSFVNGRGLKLQRYAWRASSLARASFGVAQEMPPAGQVAQIESKAAAQTDDVPPAAIIIFVHGYCVHARYEALRPAHEGAAGHTKYDGSVTHRLNEVGCDVHAFDLQGHGESEKLRKMPCYVKDFDDFAKDVIQFTEMVRKEYEDREGDGCPPVYIMGASMGGLVTIRVVQLAGNEFVDGIVLLAPAVMMLDEENFCCWYYLKKPILHFMKPFLDKVKMIHRYRATCAKMRKTEGDDPLNYWGLMHFGMASNMMEGQLRSRGGPQIELPFIILSSPNDTHVNSMGSHDMFQQCTSKDKTLCWMNNMGHSLLYEPPGCEQVIRLAVNWVLERAKPDSLRPGASELFTSERSGGYTVRREVEK